MFKGFRGVQRLRFGVCMDMTSGAAMRGVWECHHSVRDFPWDRVLCVWCGGSPTMELGLSHGVFGGLLGHGGLGGVVRALCGTTPSSHRPGDEMR